MFKIILSIFGFSLMLISIINALIKIFATDDIIAKSFGSRDLDISIIAFIFSLLLIGISEILFKIDKILKRDMPSK